MYQRDKMTVINYAKVFDMRYTMNIPNELDDGKNTLIDADETILSRVETRSLRRQCVFFYFFNTQSWNKSSIMSQQLLRLFEILNGPNNQTSRSLNVSQCAR